MTVRREITVDAPRERAFAVFTEEHADVVAARQPQRRRDCPPRR